MYDSRETVSEVGVKRYPGSNKTLGIFPNHKGHL